MALVRRFMAEELESMQLSTCPREQVAAFQRKVAEAAARLTGT